MSSSAKAGLLAPLQQRWQGLAAREKRLIGAAALVMLTALIWNSSLAPSIQLLKIHAAQRDDLDRQWLEMRTLQAQAQGLQVQAPIQGAESARLLKLFTQQFLGKDATVLMNGDRATITLQAVPAQALAQWLTQTRLQARSVPVEARITSAATPAGTAWSGQLIMSLAGS